MKNRQPFFIAAVLFISFTITGFISAQQFQVIRDSIDSQIIGEKRNLEIILPENYDSKSGVKYEVVYLLDGEWNINLVPFIHSFARGEGYLPHAIFVGLPNTYLDGVNQRDRDFLPANAADKFIEFLEEEVIPYVEKKYPANGQRTLFGHSYGGLFVTYTLLTKPQLFDAYLASDPAYHWNNGFILDYAKKQLPGLQGTKKSFWMGGIESTYKFMRISDLDSILQTQAPKDLYWKKGIYPNETHNSVRLKGVYDGLKFFYEGFSSAGIVFHPMNGIALKNKAFPVVQFSNNSNIRYTIDGTEPTSASPKFENVIILPGPAELKARSFYARGGNENITIGNFKEGETLHANPKPGDVKSGGLNYSYYKGEWDRLPDFNTLKPVHSGIADKDFDLNKMPDQNDFGCVMEGFIEISESGYYIFILDSDDGSKFYFNNELVIANDGLHGTGNSQTYMLPLEKGFYPVRLEYFQRGGGRQLDLQYVLPGQQRPVAVPFDVLYSK